MADDIWQTLADPFVEGAYASVKGAVRTSVLHEQLLRHLAGPPGTVLDVGGGAAHQSLPLARLGYEVTVLDASPAMLAKAEQRLSTEPAEVRERVRLVLSPGEAASEATGGQLFSTVLCHGVLMYHRSPDPLLDVLCRCVAPDGVVSVMALNARTMAVRPALERRWQDALAAFDASTETGVLGVPTRADTVEDLVSRLEARGVDPLAWYGVWLFSDWLALPPDGSRLDEAEVAAIAAVELEASGRDPYRQLSRVFHLVGRRRATEDASTGSLQ